MAQEAIDRRELYFRMFGKPNFIFIHTDQQRADCVNASGKRKGLYTPYQDSIANMGALFESCYSPCPVCIPQRLSLLTGQAPQRHGVYDCIGIPDLELGRTLPMLFHEGGYHTALIGRTMHTYPFDRNCGFDEYLPGDPSTDNRETDLFFRFLEENAPAGSGGYYGNGTFNNSRFAAPFHLENRFHHTMWATNLALDYIERRKADRKPFFLSLGYYAPHSPHNPPREWMDYYMGMDPAALDDPAIADYDIKPVTNGHPISPYTAMEGEELRRLRAGYYGNISFIDAQVGRILDSILMLPNTYVIFTSDHGEMLGDHYHMHKLMPYQGAVHTPFLICGPGIAGSQRISAPFTWTDVMPTLLELARLGVPKDIDGRSFAPLLLGQTEQAPYPFIHGESPLSVVRFGGYEKQRREGNLAFDNGFHYLTDGKMKYIWFTGSGREQIFDLEKDDRELHDLSGEAAWQDELLVWRGRLIRLLEGREEGFSDGTALHPGKERQLSSEMEQLALKCLSEGKKVAYYIPNIKPPQK